MQEVIIIFVVAAVVIYILAAIYRQGYLHGKYDAYSETLNIMEEGDEN